MFPNPYEPLLKKEGDGYIFRAPNPWIVGRPTHYLVSDNQRKEILALGAAGNVRRTVLLSLAITGFAVGSSLLVFASSNKANPGWIELGAMVLLTCIAAAATLLFSARVEANRLSRVIGGLPRTSHEISVQELRDAQKKQMSASAWKKLTLLSAATGIALFLALASRGHLDLTNPTQAVLAAAASVQLINAFVFLRRARSREQATS
jgi:hypothetical protein